MLINFEEISALPFFKITIYSLMGQLIMPNRTVDIHSGKRMILFCGRIVLKVSLNRTDRYESLCSILHFQSHDNSFLLQVMKLLSFLTKFVTICEFWFGLILN